MNRTYGNVNRKPLILHSMATLHSMAALCLITILCFAAACGPSQEELDAEKAKVRELRGSLQESENAKQALQDRVDTLQSQNQDMASRLRALGQDVEQLEGSLDETTRALEQLRERERQAQARLATFKKLVDRFKSMIESGRLRVRIVRNRMVVELPENVLFDSGRSEVKKDGQNTIVEVARVLKDLPKRDFQVAGHTDNMPIRTRRFPSNWELSTARALEVVKLMIRAGLNRSRLSAAGYADTQPVAANDTTAGRKQNRRIEIVLLPNLDELPDLSDLETKPSQTKPSKAKDGTKEG